MGDTTVQIQFWIGATKRQVCIIVAQKYNNNNKQHTSIDDKGLHWSLAKWSIQWNQSQDNMVNSIQESQQLMEILVMETVTKTA